jgi:hypothetical protein
LLPPCAAPPEPADDLAAGADLAGADFAGALEVLPEPAKATAAALMIPMRMNADKKYLVLFPMLAISHSSRSLF